MTQFTLYLGSSPTDGVLKDLLAAWCAERSDISLRYESIHVNPTVVVRLGITQLPALVADNQLIAQGTLENWVVTLLNYLTSQKAFLNGERTHENL